MALATCAPACVNEGQCISFNVCQCSKMYRGDHCQYNVDACNITKTDFNGNYKCSYDHELTKCSLTCPDVQGLIVHGNLEEEYKCKYSEGEFYPTPLPKCIYRKCNSFTQKKKEKTLPLLYHRQRQHSQGSFRD